jgi:simple sugar transport system ATP-binding protein
VLTPQEANELFINLQHMKESGKSVVLITHKLDEVLAVADRVTILRAGRAVATRQRGSFSKEELAEAMVGRQLPPRPDRRRPVQDAVTLQLDNATAFGDAGQIALNNLSLQVHAGEILGIAGVAGNGQRELAEVVTGLRPLHKGTMYLAGENMTNRGVTALLNKGVSHVPEDRLGSGLVPNLDAVDNVLLRTYRHGTRPGLIDYRQARRQTEELVKAFSVQLASLGSPVKLLSGGNLQRLLLARELSAGPSLIVAVYPMRGLDIAAAEEVRRLLLRERDRGAAILLISEDLDDIFRLSDRIAVLSRGSLPVPPIAAQKANREEIGLLMMGHTEVATHG